MAVSGRAAIKIVYAGFHNFHGRFKYVQTFLTCQVNGRVITVCLINFLLSMRKILLSGLSLFLLLASARSQAMNGEPLSERLTGYSFDVSLDTVARTVSGTMQAYWVNNSEDIVPDIQLHLYMNAFRDDQSTFYRERKGSPGKKEMDAGWIEMQTLTDRNGNDLLPLLEYISPDDGNAADRTVARIVLPNPVAPGDTFFMNTRFTTKLPSEIIRTGFSENFYFVAQWFPKFGVYEKAGMRYAVKGAWNCHQFHAHSEFYANHSVYDVRITVPKGYVVGTGGKLMGEEEKDGLRTLYFRAGDIVDFAWTAWPGYVEFREQWKHVSITLLMPPERINQAARQMSAVKNALGYLDDNTGPYPWSYLTFVDPPSIGSGATGMEYTTLFTTASYDIIPESIRLPEMVTVHEFGHAYFMGIMASNEFEEPWVDEGINSFWETRIMDHFYGVNNGMLDFGWLKLSDRSYQRIPYVTSPYRQLADNNRSSWDYPMDIYGMMSYQKAATWLNTLMGLTGEETMNNIFREYYRKWAFRHPSGRDFIDVVNEVVKTEMPERFPDGMDWFFDQTLYGTGICDYAVTSVLISEPDEENGYYAGSEGADSTLNKEEVIIHESHILLTRNGEICLPVEVLILFSDGTEITEKWDGSSRFKEYSFTGPAEVDRVIIDPESKITMDVNFVNNSYAVDPDTIPLKRIFGRLLSFVQFLLIFLTV